MLADPIADMLTRIRNAYAARHETTNVPGSKVCRGICRVLKDEGYIEDYKWIDDGRQGLLRIYLKYGPRGEDLFTDIRRVSRPSRRVYKDVESIPRPMGGLGISIVSTSRGILSDRQCREQKVGGEVLCTIW